MIDLDARYTRPDWVRRLNLMGDAVGGARHLVPLDPSALIDRAREATGLDDFGDVDGDWRARLDGLVPALEETGHLHVVGRLLTRQEILRCLVSRLRLAQRLRERPGVRDERVAAPMVIAGPARSGTSILQELLWLDPEARCPLAYESLQPAPGPDLAGDRHREVAECEQELWSDVQPEFAAVHELAAHLPMECIALRQPSFGGFHWSMIADIPGYVPDFPAAMAYHRAALQSLQHGAPPRTWVLKTPVYLMMLDLVFETYPDAAVIVTHRDPVKTLPSGFSTLATVRWLRSDRVDLSGTDGTGAGLLLLALMQREQAGTLPGPVHHLQFADLMRDPAGAIEKLYAALGRPFTAAYRQSIVDYLASKPKGKHGTHRYAPEDWDMDTSQIREAMKPYMDYYDVPEEA